MPVAIGLPGVIKYKWLQTKLLNCLKRFLAQRLTEPGKSHQSKDHLSVVKEAKQEMPKHLSTRQAEIDYCYKSELFAK